MPPTSGFTLAALPRSPNVPGNIGKIGEIDAREIYDAVRAGLQTVEAAGQSPNRALLAQNQTATSLAEGAARREVLPALTQATLADTPNKSRLLAEKVSPERIALEREALKKRSAVSQTGAVQTANALVAAQMRLAEDPTDEEAKLLVSVLTPMATKIGAASLTDPKSAMEQKGTLAAAADATKKEIAAGQQQTAKDIALARIDADKSLSAEERALKIKLAEMGFQSRADTTAANNKAKIEVARSSMLGRANNKEYKDALDRSERIQKEMLALDTIEEAAENYLKSTIGSGVVVGSPFAVFLRSLVGDDTGKKFQAAISISMESALQTMRGLGAMSVKEFEAAMKQLPNTNDPEESIKLKLDYLHQLRNWTEARNNMYLDELAKGASTIQAGQKIRSALPMPRFGQVPDDDAATPSAPGMAAPTWNDEKEKRFRELEAKMAQPAQP